MPVEEIGKLVHEKSPKALFHVDAIQAFGKYRIYPKKLGIDLLSVSSHKIHGPKGVGFLYINEKVRVQPQILGGGQQNGMRSGTDNVPGIAGLGVAADMVYTDFDKKIQQLYALKERMAQSIKLDFEVARMEPLFASQEAYDAFNERQSQYNVATGDLASYEGNCFLGIDAGSTTNSDDNSRFNSFHKFNAWSVKMVPCCIRSMTTTTGIHWQPPSVPCRKSIPRCRTLPGSPTPAPPVTVKH